MGKRLSYILLLIGCMLFIACTDNILQETACGKVELKLTLNLPEEEVNSSSRVTGSNTDTPYLDETTKEQRYIKDVAILAMRNGKVDFIPENITLEGDEGDQGSNIRTITMTVPASDQPIDILVLLNAKENGIDVTEDNYIGKTEEEVHDKLVFKYPVNTWDINDRKLPMFGKAKDIDISSLHSFGYCDIYRSLAKMAVQVDEDCKTFNLKEVYLYYMEQEGYFMSAHTPETDVYTQYTQPDVPTTSVQTGTDNAKKFDVTDNAIFNKIYLPESNNKTPQNSKKELKVVVGGIYTGEGLVESGELSYYRIDMSDERDQPFDIIRNHSYIFNIINVENPGTPSPDKALDHAVPALKVEVEDWVTEYMRGVPDQYTLTVSKSVITLKDYMDFGQDHTYTFDVWTDYSEGWKIETEDGKIIGTDSKPIDWLDIANTTGTANNKITVLVNANKINTGLTKTATFYVKAGNIRKEITVVMPQPETANCYVVGDGVYEIIVSIKGNGIDGTRPEGKDIVPTGDASVSPHHLGIIWETQKGLIELQDYTTGKYVSGNTISEGEIPTVPYNKETSTLRYSVRSNITNAYIAGAPGGNALIGAFNEAGQVIWSWHIWVCPEMYDSQTHQIKEGVFLDTWSYTGYQVMDRNLGALTDLPIDLSPIEGKNLAEVSTNQYGVAAMGLQYQWGRKDPFIGPAYSNDNFKEGDNTGLLPVVHYYEEWGINNNQDPATAIDYTITHPTQLVYWLQGTDNDATALVSSTIKGNPNGGYLWGTDAGLNKNIKELGTKTIYDPCPVGYRVPPVDAFYFEDPDATIIDNGIRRKRNSYDDNFRYNVIFIPHYPESSWPKTVIGHDFTPSGIQWGDYSEYDNWNDQYYYIIYRSEYIKDAYYYGFYLNYSEISEPDLNSNDKRNGITPANNNVLYYYKVNNTTGITWLPLTGAYAPALFNDNNKNDQRDANEDWYKGNVSYKDNAGSTIQIERGSTISVNSFLWTNSSISSGNKKRPVSLALHGTEVTGSALNENNRYDNDGNGRHLHALNDYVVQIYPHYTSAVRCIKDTKKISWDNINSLSPNAQVTSGGSTTITVKSVNSSWKLIDPGAPWLLVTPDKGEADKGAGTTIELIAAETFNGQSTHGLSTVIKIQIEGEDEPRSCTVTVN